MKLLQEKIDRITQIKGEFQEKYLDKEEPYHQYINSCGVSSLNTRRIFRRDSFVLEAGESLDDLCLVVHLKEAPPADLDLPARYQGARVFYDVVGETTPRG